jgi:Rab guanine nucleotide exchange factor SEC2
VATPPPLPRRAPARGSRLTVDGSPRPGTPVAGANSNAGPSVDPALKEADQDKVEGIARDEEHSAGKDDPAKMVEEEGKEQEQKTGTGTEDGVARLESPVEMEMAGEKAKKEKEGVGIIEELPHMTEGEREEGERKIEEERVEEEQKEAEAEAEAEGDTPDREEQMVDAEKVVNGNDRDWEEVQAEDANGDKDSKSDDDKTVKFTEAKDLKSDESNGAFVGDTTWEERTWKELVRLREEMFWARIGALRQ